MTDDQAQKLTDQVKDQLPSNNGSGGMKSVLLPVAATAAAAAAAGLAATKGPDLMRKLSGEANEEAEEIGRKGAEGAKQELGSGGGLAGKAASKLFGGGSGGKDGGGKSRRLPIQRWTDVAVSVEKAYDAWTNFEEFPKFMHRVLEVKPEDDKKIHWQEKIWFSSREWDGEITTKRKNDRIAWKSVSGTQHSGLISFHRLDSKLTRVLVTVDFVPTGMIEKMASGMRFVKRAVESDLARFKAYVEFADVEGIEYRSSPEEMEQHREADDGEDGEGQDAKSSAGDSESRDRDSEREERESRRQERRKALSGS